jgi:hypothetical protein
VITRRLLWGAVALGLFLPVPILAHAAGAVPSITPAKPTVHWTGGPIFSGHTNTCPSGNVCDDFSLAVNVPSGHWARHPGGVTVRVDWSRPSNVLELAVYDPSGKELGFSGYGNVNYQQIYLAAPANGQYLVEVVNYAAADARYTGTARLVGQRIPLARQQAGGMQFSHTLVDPQILTADPGVAADPWGRVYVTSRHGEGSPTGSFLWASADGGRTFSRAGDHVAGPFHDPRYRPCAAAADAAADVDATADRTGRLYLADVGTATLTAGFSTDHGQTWFCAPVPSATGSDDRPWVTPGPNADGTGPGVDAYLLYQAGAFIGEHPIGSTATPEQLRIALTRDGGLTWTAGGAFAVGKASIPGEFFTNARGYVYEVFSADNAVWLAESRDEGRTFTVHLVSKRLGDPRGDGWTAGGTDAHGVVYAAWVDQGSWAVLYTRSTDGGRQWSTPKQISAPGTTANKVWLAAGRGGDVAVAWYGARGIFPLYVTPASAQWHVWAARSTNAAAANATFAVTQVTDTPVGFGPQRDINNSSVSASLSDFGDDLRVTLAPSGALLVSYADLGYATAQQAAFVVVARQVRGVGMSEPAAPPEPSHLSTACPQLRFASLPSVSQQGGDAVLTFRLASTTDLAHTPQLCARLATRRDASWVAIWKTHGHRQYAGLTVHSVPGSTATLRFGGGLDPAQMAAVSGLVGSIAVTYPAAKPLAGAIDAASGRVTIRVPMSAFGLRSGADMYDVQLFSLLGNAALSTPMNIFVQGDVTPSKTLRIGG